jgi:hypothetical protein
LGHAVGLIAYRFSHTGANTMQTFQSMHDELNRSGNPCSYWGESGDWLVFMGRNRDSDIVTNCNWDEAIKELDRVQALFERKYPDVDDPSFYTIERENHWACGWVEYILINPTIIHARAIARILLDRLEDYPVLDEMALSDAESEDAVESWDAYGRYDCVRELEKQIEGADEFDDSTLDEAFEYARQNVDWEYQFDGVGCNFNTEGIVEKAIEKLTEMGLVE